MLQTKICGIVHPNDAIMASESGANAIGLVFYAPSKRNLADYGLAREIAMAAQPFTQVVALFVNETPANIEQILTQVPINLIQFHGGEDNTFCRQFDRPFIKAVRMKPDVNIHQEAEKFTHAKALLLDAYQKGVPGGTGATFSWDRIPTHCDKPLILAGGLTPQNITKAVSQTPVAAIDVSGGVELDGQGMRKDPNKVKRFITNAHQAYNLRQHA